uniref:hypothetical protein n=1 Tax=Anabaena sp. CCY 0017 TaxID=3103866 RepID=UPI0039C640BA
AAGAVGAAQGLAAVVGPIAGTLAYQASPGAPYVIGATLVLTAALWPSRRPSPEQTASVS